MTVRLACLAAAVSACFVLPLAPARSASRPGPEELRVGGSPRLLPLLARRAAEFIDAYGSWDRVDPAWPAERIVISVGGGDAELEALRRGELDIAMAAESGDVRGFVAFELPSEPKGRLLTRGRPSPRAGRFIDHVLAAGRKLAERPR